MEHEAKIVYNDGRKIILQKSVDLGHYSDSIIVLNVINANVDFDGNNDDNDDIIYKHNHFINR
jgi:hypothetical protein